MKAARQRGFIPVRRVFQTAVALALCLSLGLHWAVLQSVAWTGMLVDYSRSGAISEAIQKTFDGRHPCKLCKLVSEGKKSEKKQESAAAGNQLDPCVQFEIVAYVFPDNPARPLGGQFDFFTRSRLPSIPPPKSA
jgi:hypothetical protein